MTYEKRKRLDELLAAQRASARRRETERLHARLTEEIPDFDVKYSFCGDEQNEALGSVAEEIHQRLTAAGGIENFSACKAYSPNKTGKRLVFMEFFLGSRDIFRVFVGGAAEVFVADLEDWQDFDPFDSLIFDDLSGFLFIDRGRNITEIII